MEHREVQELKMLMLPTQLMRDVDENCLKEEIAKCKHFSLGSEMENRRHKVFDFVMDPLNPKKLLETLAVEFDSLKCATKLNVILGFVLNNSENGSCIFSYAYETNRLLERLKLMAAKEDQTKIKEILSNTDVIESCTRKRANTQWKFF